MSKLDLRSFLTLSVTITTLSILIFSVTIGSNNSAFTGEIDRGVLSGIVIGMAFITIVRFMFAKPSKVNSEPDI